MRPLIDNLKHVYTTLLATLLQGLKERFMKVCWLCTVFREKRDCLIRSLCGRMFVGTSQNTRLGSNHQPDNTFWSNTFLSWTSLLEWSAALLPVFVSLLSFY